MDDSKKKPIMIGVVVLCLIVAGLLFSKMRSSSGGVGGMSDDEKVWIKSNPNLGVSVRWDYLEKRIQAALLSPAKQNKIKTSTQMLSNRGAFFIRNNLTRVQS